MTRTGCSALFAVGLLVACQHGKDKDAQPSPAYPADIERICNVLHLSGADASRSAEAQLVTADWLAKNLQSPESHQFLIKIQPLDNAAKATALDAEAKRVGLADCALSAEWRK